MNISWFFRKDTSLSRKEEVGGLIFPLLDILWMKQNDDDHDDENDDEKYDENDEDGDDEENDDDDKVGK